MAGGRAGGRPVHRAMPSVMNAATLVLLGCAATAGEFERLHGFVPLTEPSAASNPITMSIDDAMSYCGSNTRCITFTFQGEPDPSRAVPIFFKMSSLVVPSSEWTSYRRVFSGRLGPTVSHRAPAPSMSHHHARPSSSPSHEPCTASGGCAPPSPARRDNCTRAAAPLSIELRVASAASPPSARASFAVMAWDSTTGIRRPPVEQGTLAPGEVRTVPMCVGLDACYVISLVSADGTNDAGLEWKVGAPGSTASAPAASGHATFGKRLCVPEIVGDQSVSSSAGIQARRASSLGQV